MKKSLSRILSVLLSVCMLLSSAPVMAEGSDGENVISLNGSSVPGQIAVDDGPELPSDAGTQETQKDAGSPALFGVAVVDTIDQPEEPELTEQTIAVTLFTDSSAAHLSHEPVVPTKNLLKGMKSTQAAMQTTDAKAADGEASDGQASDGKAPDGKADDGETTISITGELPEGAYAIGWPVDIGDVITEELEDGLTREAEVLGAYQLELYNADGTKIESTDTPVTVNLSLAPKAAKGQTQEPDKVGAVPLSSDGKVDTSAPMETRGSGNNVSVTTSILDGLALLFNWNYISNHMRFAYTAVDGLGFLERIAVETLIDLLWMRYTNAICPEGQTVLEAVKLSRPDPRIVAHILITDLPAEGTWNLYSIIDSRGNLSAEPIREDVQVGDLIDTTANVYGYALVGTGEASSQTLSVEDPDGTYRVTVTYDSTTGIPVRGTRLEVVEIDRESDQYEACRALAGEALNGLEEGRLFEIRIVDEETGEVLYEPSDDTLVDVLIELLQVNYRAGREARVIHLVNNTAEVLDVDVTRDGNDYAYSFRTGSLSPFMVSYTVDFWYNGYAFSIPGGSGILLSEIFERLSFNFPVSDVENVEFTNTNLVSVEKEGEDWKLTSLQPFDSEETLTVMLTDGSWIEIAVEDDIITNPEDAVFEVIDKRTSNGNIFAHFYCTSWKDVLNKIFVNANDRAGGQNNTVEVLLLADEYTFTSDDIGTFARLTSGSLTINGNNGKKIKRGTGVNGNLITWNPSGAGMLTIKNITFDNGSEDDPNSSILNKTSGELQCENVTLNGNMTDSSLVRIQAGISKFTDCTIIGGGGEADSDVIRIAGSDAAVFDGGTIKRGKSTGNLVAHYGSGNITLRNLTVNGTCEDEAGQDGQIGHIIHEEGTGNIMIGGTGSFPNVTIIGGTAYTSLIHRNSNGSITVSNARLIGADGGDRHLIYNGGTGTVTVQNNSELYRGGTTGAAINNAGSGKLIINNSLISGAKSNTDSDTVSATSPLIMHGTGDLTLTDVTVSDHVSSEAGVCAVDASGASTVTFAGAVSITGNKDSDNEEVNINVGSKKINISENHTGSVGITSSDNNNPGDTFSVQLGTAITAGTFTNDKNKNLKGMLINRKLYWVEKYDGTDSAEYRDGKYYYKGFQYELSVAQAVPVGFDSQYTGIRILSSLVPYNGMAFSVYDISNLDRDSNSSHFPVIGQTFVLDDDLVLRMYGGSQFSLPDLVTSLLNTSEVEGFTAGVNNESSPYEIWKKASYNAETNQIEYTLKYFQKMSNTPLDFIIVYDESDTMWNHVHSLNGISAARAIWAAGALQLMSKALLEKEGYTIKIKLIPFESHPRTDCGWLSSYDEVKDYLSKHWINGGTDHGEAATAAANAARNANAGHLPIVIYISDIVSHAGLTHRGHEVIDGETVNRYEELVDMREAADNHVYVLKIFNGTDTSPANQWAGTKNRVKIANDVDAFIGGLEEIVKEAIGYYISSTLEIKDFLSPSFSSRTPSAGAGTGTIAANTGNITWSFGNQRPAGVLYTAMFTVSPDGDKVYSGSAPTNQELIVKDGNSELNTIPESNSPLLRKSVTLLKKATDTDGDPIEGARFTLARGSNSWTDLTTDSNGKVSIPWASEDSETAAAFKAGDVYTLTEDSTNDGTVKPGGSWTLTVNPDYSITAAVVNASGTKVNRTNMLAARNGEFEVYNDTEPTVIYNANEGTFSGSGSPTDRTDPVDFDNTETSHAYTVRGTDAAWLPERDGYLFIGWNTAANGTGTGYTPGDTMTVYRNSETDAEIVLYAQYLDKARCIARVSNEVDADGNPINWTYHEWLLTEDNTETVVQNGVSIKKGAFNRANTLTGDVIIETLKQGFNGTSDDTKFDGDTTGRYTLSGGYAFNKAGMDSLTLRTTTDTTWNPGRFMSVIRRGYDVTSGNELALIKAQKTFTVDSIIFDGKDENDTLHPGRAIYAIARTLTVRNSTFRNLRNNIRGGAIRTDVEATIENSSFYDCQATNAGTGTGGGAIYAAQALTILNETAEDCGFYRCTSNTNGGAIQVYKNATSGGYPITIRNTSSGKIIFDSCSSNNSGGAIDNYGCGAFTVENTGTGKVSFKDCHGNSGGAVYNGTYGSVTITNSNSAGEVEFTGCLSTGAYEGGGIHTGTVSIENAGTITFDGCKTNPGTRDDGGGIYANSTVTVSGTGNLKFKNCEGKNGGGIYAKGAVTIQGGAGVEFNSCKARVYGGGIYAAQDVTVTGTGGSSFTDCSATSGGGIYQAGGDSLNLTKVTFGEDGKADKGCFAEMEGGSVYSNNSSSTITDCSFYYSKAGSGTNDNNTHGGAIAQYGEGSYQILGCVFDHCSANTTSYDISHGNGGAVYISDKGTSLVIDRSAARRSSFTNCSAYRYGGAVIMEKNGGCTLSISHTDFADCYTTFRDGGAVYTDSTTTSFTECTFKGCHSDSTGGDSNGGGAIYTNGDRATIASTITINGCLFEDCYVQRRGGAIYFYSTGTNATLTNVQVTGHTSPPAGTATDHTSLPEGTANAELGGAIYSKGNITIRQEGTGVSRIQSCSASDPNGGAVNVASGKTMTFAGKVEVYDNKGTGALATQQKNVVLDRDSNSVILTTAAGLSEEAKIGVYVTGNMTQGAEESPFKEHGGSGDPFGTYGNDGDYTCFINDRLSVTAQRLVRGTAKKATDSINLMYWERLDVALTIAKFVTGAMGDYTKAFNFTLTGLTAGAQYSYKLYSSEDGTTYTEMAGPADDATTAGGVTTYRKTADSSGRVTFTLKHRQKIELMIPAGTQASLTEQTDYYTATFAAVKTDKDPEETVTLTTLPDGASGNEVNGVSLKAEENTTATVTNNLDAVSPTGITLTYMPYLLILLCGAAILLLRRRKQG